MVKQPYVSTTDYRQVDRMDALERRWVLRFALFVMALTTIPYLVGYARQGDEWRFSGFVFGVEDGNSYIAKMLSGAYGAWLFRTPYTAMGQKGVIAFLPYLILGKLAAPPGVHEQLVALFHFFRYVSGTLAIFATYEFLATFLELKPLRRLGLVLATLGGGLGWIMLLIGHFDWLGSLPLDFYSPETVGFLSLYGLPHLSLARAGLLWGLVAYVRAMKGEGQNLPSGQARSLGWDGTKVGGWWLVTGLAQPLTALVMGVVMSLHLLLLAILKVVGGWKKAQDDWNRWVKLLKQVIVAGLIAAPFLLYNAVVFSTDPFLKAWTSQNIISSPHPLHYLLAYGLLLPLAIWGGLRLARESRWEGWLVMVWVLALPFLVYLPVNIQRRLSEGAWVAVVLLAMKGLEGLTASRGHRSAWIKYALLAFSLPSTLILIGGGMLTAYQPMQPAFRPREEVRAFEFLEGYARGGEVILSAYETGNALPAWAPLRVVIGHGPESVGLPLLQRQVEAFFQNGSEDEMRLALIREQKVSFVFWGPRERSLGDWDPAAASYLRRVYRSGSYEIFEVTHPGVEQ